MLKTLFWLLSVLVVASLVGVGFGIALHQQFLTLGCVFAVILFMWLGFFVKGRQQAADQNQKTD